MKRPKAMSTDEAGERSPLVSIIVLYYRRRDTIEETLRSAARQEYPHREIIVVDNHSEDDLRQVVAEVGGIRLIEMPENVGACAGRNAGIRAARGDLLVLIDDDVSFASPFETGKIVRSFRDHPEMHGLALQICDPRSGQVRIREWCHTRPYREFVDREFETNFFGEGASAFRREVFERCGDYYEPLFYGAEGHDMVLRILDHGFRILHVPQIRVNHWAAEEGRSTGRQLYYYTRNFVWMGYKDYPSWRGVAFTVPKVLMMLYFAWRTSGYGPFLRGLWDGLRGLGAVRHDRTPVRRETRRYMAEQEKWRPGLLARLARHRQEPQI